MSRGRSLNDSYTARLEPVLTLFEFISVAYSLVLSFAVVRLLGGVSDVFAPGRRYWIHCAWLCLQILGVLVAWWTFWSYRTIEWNVFRFLLIIAGPGLVYLQASALIPPDPSSVDCWKDHYYRTRGLMFGAGAIWLALLGIHSYVLLDFPLLHSRRALNVVFIAGMTVAAVSGRKSVHTVITVGYAIGVVFFLTAFLFDPDSWALQR